jgi:hypothetical protein
MCISIKPPTDDQQKETRRGKNNNNVNTVILISILITSYPIITYKDLHTLRI